jgi:hypothetical protein
MAKKTNGMKFEQEIRGQAAVTNHQSASQVALYLKPPHLQALKVLPPKPRLQIAIEIDTRVEVPSPVEIIHTA